MHSKDPVMVEGRFWKRVHKTDGCWLWTGTKVGPGYGHMMINGRMIRAHRYAWTLARGEIPDGMFLLHRCDVPACVRVDHLFLGTQGDNMRDMDAKGRRNYGTLVGSRHGRTRLTEEQVIAMRAEHKAGAKRAILAAKYGIKLDTLKQIIYRRVWRHI